MAVSGNSCHHCHRLSRYSALTWQLHDEHPRLSNSMVLTDPGLQLQGRKVGQAGFRVVVAALVVARVVARVAALVVCFSSVVVVVGRVARVVAAWVVVSGTEAPGFKTHVPKYCS